MWPSLAWVMSETAVSGICSILRTCTQGDYSLCTIVQNTQLSSTIDTAVGTTDAWQKMGFFGSWTLRAPMSCIFRQCPWCKASKQLNTLPYFQPCNVLDLFVPNTAHIVHQRSPRWPCHPLPLRFSCVFDTACFIILSYTFQFYKCICSPSSSTDICLIYMMEAFSLLSHKPLESVMGLVPWDARLA